MGIGHNITERKQRERELEAIAAIAMALRAASTRNEMISVIVHQTFDLLQADGVSLALREPTTGETVIAFGQDRRQEWAGRRFPPGMGILGQVIANGRAYLTNDVQHDPYMLPLDPKDYLQSVACVPLVVQEEVIGALWVGKLTPISDGELRVLSSLSDIAANALQRASVIETLEQRVADRTRELTEANAKLTELDRMKDQFVTNVSHELRTPLTSIMLQSELLEHGRLEKREVYLNTLRRETLRLRKLIEDLLDLSRLDRDVVPIRPVPTDLNQLLGQLVVNRTALAAQHGLALEFKPTPDLPWASADPAPLLQVISNLLTNAVNYTPPGGRVTVMTGRQLHAAQDWVTCTVRDTGPGISAADLPHLFERFYRGEVGRKTSAPGTGLGLAISKEIIDQPGGLHHR